MGGVFWRLACIGGKGWLEMADSARVQQMLAAIELDVYGV
jgi:hypothetical protein